MPRLSVGELYLWPRRGKMKQLWSVWPTQVTQCILMLEHTSAANMLRCSHILTLQKYVQSKIWGLSFKHIVNKSLHCMNSLKRSILLDPAPTLRPSINCFCLFNPGSHSSTQLPIHSPLFPFFSYQSWTLGCILC